MQSTRPTVCSATDGDTAQLRDLRAPLRDLARTLSERLGWTSESLKNG
jgi:hypothetical protein